MGIHLQDSCASQLGTALTLRGTSKRSVWDGAINGARGVTETSDWGDGSGQVVDDAGEGQRAQLAQSGGVGFSWPRHEHT
jgi:hypothetical protein